jgi:hypothetical protein
LGHYDRRLGHDRRCELDELLRPTIAKISGVRPALNVISRKILFH